jgi:SPP1 family predicted phage head-tail adaptor
MANLTRFQRRHRAGALRNRADLEALTATSTAAGSRGQPQEDWTLVDPVRIGIFTLQGREAELVHEIVPTATHLVVSRYHQGVKPEARFRLGNRVLNVQSVDDAENRHRWMDSVCIEEVLST